MSQLVDQILYAGTLIPVIPENCYWTHQAIAIHDGKICAIGSKDSIDRQYHSDNTTALDNHIVMPGLVNCHNHAAMSLFRGYSDDLPLKEWLEQAIWPAEAKHVSPEFVYEGTELAIAEMIKSGTTCFSDMYFFPDEAARCAHKAGIRCQITFPVLEFPTPWAQSVDEYISKGLAFYDDYRAHPLIQPAFGPHAPYTVSDDTFARIASLAAEMQAQIQIHLHETEGEVQAGIDQHKKRPIERLNDLGILGPMTQCVHMTALSDEDISLVRHTGASIIHCPESNLKLASGFSPIHKCLREGINVALGTDGCASNNNQDLFGEMHTAALLAKAVSGDASALKAHEAIAMATINGAKALGLESEIGSIEVGKSADIIAIELDSIDHQPLFNPISLLTYTHNGHRVTHSWVNGRPLMIEKTLCTVSRESIYKNAKQWRKKIGDTL